MKAVLRGPLHRPAAKAPWGGLGWALGAGVRSHPSPTPITKNTSCPGCHPTSPVTPLPPEPGRVGSCPGPPAVGTSQPQVADVLASSGHMQVRGCSPLKAPWPDIRWPTHGPMAGLIHGWRQCGRPMGRELPHSMAASALQEEARRRPPDLVETQHPTTWRPFCPASLVQHVTKAGPDPGEESHLASPWRRGRTLKTNSHHTSSL